MTENFDENSYEIAGVSIADLRKVFTEGNIRPLENSDDNVGYAFGPIKMQIPSRPEITAVKGSTYYEMPAEGAGAAIYSELRILEQSRWKNKGRKLSSIVKGNNSSDFLAKCLERTIALTTAKEGVRVKKR